MRVYLCPSAAVFPVSPVKLRVIHMLIRSSCQTLCLLKKVVSFHCVSLYMNNDCILLKRGTYLGSVTSLEKTTRVFDLI